jgi:hypothetical protein
MGENKKKAFFITSAKWNNSSRDILSTHEMISKKFEVIIVSMNINNIASTTNNDNVYDYALGIENRYLRWFLSRNISMIPFFTLLFLALKFRPTVIYLLGPRLHISVVLIRIIFPNMKYILDFLENPKVFHPSQIPFLKIFGKYVDRALAVSTELREDLKNTFGYKDIRVKYSLPASNFMSDIESCINDNSKIKICFFGNVCEDRIVHYLVEAANKTSIEIVCDIYGEVFGDGYQEKLDKLNSNNVVRFRGKLKYSEAQGRLNQYDCGIVFNEINENSKLTIPGKLWEYACSNLCIISNNRPTVVNFINKYQIGLIADSVDDLISVFEKLSHDRIMLNQFKINSKEMFDHIYKKQVNKSYID